MKNVKAIFCVLLAIAMVFAVCACDKYDGDEDKTDTSSTPTSQGAIKSNAAAEESTAPTNSETEQPTVESKDSFIISTVDDYLNRPHGIQQGTTVTLIAMNDVPSQLPWGAASEGWLLFNIYESLLHPHLGDVNDIRGLIAESWTHSEDYLTWTFQIRDGVKFHDGTVCDAPAIAKSWDFYNEMSPASFNNVNMISWESKSDKEFVVTLSAPCAYFEAQMTRLYVVSPTALNLYGTGDNAAAIGTGPYYIDSYTPGVGFVFKANTDYYFEEKMPCIETFNFSIIGDENTKLMALLNGDVDGYQFRVIESFYNLRDSGFDGTLIQNYENCNPLFLNAKKVPEFQIFEARKAMNRFIDQDAINKLVYDEMGLVQKSIWTVGSSSEVPSDQFYYNRDEGLELMASVGVDPSNLSFRAPIINRQAPMFVAIQGLLNEVGITMEIEALEPQANLTFLKNGDWSLTGGNSGYTDSSPYAPWGMILKPEHLIKECWQDIYDPDLYQKMVDEYEAMKVSPTWDEMLAHCKQLTIYLQDDFGAMPGIQQPFFGAYNKELKAIVYYSEMHYLLLYYMYKG